MPTTSNDLDELSGWSPGWRLVELMAARQVSPVEVMSALLARIERLDPTIHAFMATDPESALAQARAAEASIARGDPLGPLHGLPVAVKDNLWTAGMVTTGGSALYKDFVPAQDNIAVERTRAAGGIIVGKTHLPEFAAFPRTINRLVAECVNPWDTTRVTGASSGGSGAAVAAGMVPVALGTDGGGSTRLPAALCGIFGLQPSRGVVPSWGRVGYVRFSGIGPMTRDVRDGARLLDVIAGPDPRDPASDGVVPAEYEAGLDAGVSGLRVAWLDDLGEFRAAPEVVAMARDAVGDLEGAGVKVEVPDVRFERMWEVLATVGQGAHQYEGAPAGFADTPEVREAALDPSRQHLLAPHIVEAFAAPAVTPQRYAAAQQARSTAIDTLADLFERYDLLLTPTAPVVAPPAPEDPWANPFSSTEYYTSLTSLANITEVTAASVPCGFVEGLPVGLQVIGPAGSELLVLRASRSLEQVRPWAHVRPSL
jgi:aspartyl-tRNA(Asn)/glutamyl-tRNA(Gln) amidotransferase subunit A